LRNQVLSEEVEHIKGLGVKNDSGQNSSKSSCLNGCGENGAEQISREFEMGIWYDYLNVFYCFNDDAVA